MADDREKIREELRIAGVILQIAKDHNYMLVIPYLKENVDKLTAELKALDNFSASWLMKKVVSALTPSSPKEEGLLPFTTDQCTQPLQ